MPPGSLQELTEATIFQRIKAAQAKHDFSNDRWMGESSGSSELPLASLRLAAVLVPLLRYDGQWRLLFTRRTETVHSHKGQVSFPGGAAEPQDAGPETTALREAYEEIGLLPESVRVLGELVSRPTITHFIVTPVVGLIPWPVKLHLSASEVTRVFTIPLHWLAEPANREERAYLLPNGSKQTVIHYQPYDGEILWGASARITVDLLEVLGIAE